MKKISWRKIVIKIGLTLFAITLSGPLILSACMGGRPLDPLYAGPVSLPQELQKIFAYEGLTTDYCKQAGESALANGVRIKHVTFLSEFSTPENQTHVEMLHYDQAGETKVPAILILPILNGDNTLEKFFAKKFANQGFAVFITNGKERSTDLREYGHFDETIIKLTIEQRKALDYICAQSDIDTDNIFLFDISMGAIKATLLAAVDQRINASVIILGGGNLPELITESKEDGVEFRVKELMEAKKLTTLEELQHHLRQNIQIDPVFYAPYIDARKVFMVMASRDQIVPYHCQQELWEALGKPQALILPTGHINSILYIFQMRGIGPFNGIAVKFFRKNFVSESDGP